ncbi:MAG: type II secretion system secretin GspD, partial [Kiritimatiellaeota bacterium]|nr:type II secretion system secretin GspD [Kiritimatiellota bacterium]
VLANVGRLEGMPLTRVTADKDLPETDQLISHIVSLKYMEVPEAQAIIQGVLHGFGKIQPIERTRSLLITDTSANLQRIMEILEFADQQSEGRVETKVYEMKHGEAAAIAAKLNDLIQDAQAKADTARVAVTPTYPVGIIRAPRPVSAGDANSLSEGELFQGRVKIMADERTNIILLIARPSNFPLFDRIIEILDRQVDPEVIARVHPLRWAVALETAGLLNDLIGGTSGSSGSIGAGSPVGGSATGGAATRTSATSRSSLGSSTGSTTAGRGTTSRYGSRSSTAARGRQTGGGATPSGYVPGAASAEQLGLGQISPYTRILPDPRTNSLLLMGTKQDLALLQQVIDQLDVMLAQVLIEAVILEVELTKETQMGIDWLQRSMLVYNKQKAGPGGGLVTRQTVGSFGGGWSAGGGSIPDSAAIGKGFALPQGLTYYSTITGLNIDAVLKMLASSSNARILSTPVIMATDNTEAEIKNATQRPVVTGTTTYGVNNSGGVQSTYEYVDIGIDLIVTPHINPNRMVIMDISQTADSLGGEVTIDNNQVPIINKRQIKGSITVADRATIVLGGLVKTDSTKTRTKIPFLGDIPFLGALFRTDDNKSGRTELLVLITPYVLQTPEEARAETARLHRETAMPEVMTKGWTDSPLAKPDPEKVRQQQHEDWKQPQVRSGASALLLRPPPPTVGVATNNAATPAPQR